MRRFIRNTKRELGKAAEAVGRESNRLARQAEEAVKDIIGRDSEEVGGVPSQSSEAPVVTASELPQDRTDSGPADPEAVPPAEAVLEERPSSETVAPGRGAVAVSAHQTEGGVVMLARPAVLHSDGDSIVSSVEASAVAGAARATETALGPTGSAGDALDGATSCWPPPRTPFSQRLRLTQIQFEGGPAALPSILLHARHAQREGAFGTVVFGRLAGTSIPVAIKILRPCNDNDGLRKTTQRSAFLKEVDFLNEIRSRADAVRVLKERGHPLTLEDSGAANVVYAYGAGDEPDLSCINPSLPPEPVFVIAMEPLSETLSSRLRNLAASRDRLPVCEVIRIAHGIALGLVFIHSIHIVVSACWIALCTRIGHPHHAVYPQTLVHSPASLLSNIAAFRRQA